MFEISEGTSQTIEIGILKRRMSTIEKLLERLSESENKEIKKIKN